LGRGGAIYRTKIKNLKTNTILEEAFRPTDKFETVDLSLETMSFMYRAGDEAFFVHPRTYNQIGLSIKKIGDFAKFLKEGENYRLQFIAGEPVGILPPAKIKRRVIQSPEAVAGNTATAATKKVIVEGKIQIETPLFIKTGDKIIIRTEDEAYVSKAQEEKK
jgi:elongation factor P